MEQLTFEDVIDRYQQSIYRFCYHLLKQQQDAEDATQEVFIKAYKGYAHLRNIEVISSWLYKIAYYHCLNNLRRKKVVRFLPFINYSEENSSSVNYVSDIDVELENVLDQLSIKDKTILILRVVEDKDFIEIGDILGKSSSSARKQFERVKKKVRKLLTIEKEVIIDDKISVL